VLTSGTRQTSNIARFDLTTASSARTAIDSLETILNKINLERGNIGASQSRLQSSLSVSLASTVAFSAAHSRIVDADIAAESGQLVRTQIVREAAASVLAQANQQPALALSLLRAS
jgi:flagellin